MNRIILFLDNCGAMRETFRFSNKFTYYLSAARLTAKGMKVSAEELKRLHGIVKDNVRFVSPLRDIEPAVISMLAEREDEDRMLDRLKAAYKSLKQEFAASEYVALSALMIAVSADESEFDQKAHAVRELYDAFRTRHRFVTSHSEVPVSTFLALRGASPEEAADEAQACYDEMREKFRFRCSWSLAVKLTLDGHTTSEKCREVAALRAKLKKERRAMTLYYELASIACNSAGMAEAANEALSLYSALHMEKGFGRLNLDDEERLMLAYMVVCPSDELFFLALSGYYEKRAAIAAAAAAT